MAYFDSTSIASASYLALTFPGKRLFVVYWMAYWTAPFQQWKMYFDPDVFLLLSNLQRDQPLTQEKPLSTCQRKLLNIC